MKGDEEQDVPSLSPATDGGLTGCPLSRETSSRYIVVTEREIAD